MAYIWVSRLRYGAFPDTAVISRFHSYVRSDAPRKPFIHAAFVLLFVLCVVAFLCTMFCDPGVCATPRHALKSVFFFFFFLFISICDFVQAMEDLIRRNRLATEAFCVQCLVGSATDRNNFTLILRPEARLRSPRTRGTAPGAINASYIINASTCTGLFD